MATNTEASSSSAPAATDAPQKMFLRSKTTPEYTVEVGPSVINCCSILTNVNEHTNDSDAVEVDMTPKQLEKFIALHNHFPSTAAVTDKDTAWTNAFFKEMPDAEFKELCWKADYLDSQRFLEAAGDFVQHIIEEMEVAAIQKYLNCIDDYTADERKSMEEHPLEFFTGVSMQQDGAGQDDASGDSK